VGSVPPGEGYPDGAEQDSTQELIDAWQAKVTDMVANGVALTPDNLTAALADLLTLDAMPTGRAAGTHAATVPTGRVITDPDEIRALRIRLIREGFERRGETWDAATERQAHQFLDEERGASRGAGVIRTFPFAPRLA
jgi:hypothetical protein